MPYRRVGRPYWRFGWGRETLLEGRRGREVLPKVWEGSGGHLGNQIRGICEHFTWHITK